MTARQLIRVAISLALFLCFIAYIHGSLPLRLVDQLERFSYDARVRLTMPGTVDKRIVIVDIDDKTLKEQGQWPLPRDKFAVMMDQLFNLYHVKLVAFDISFPEADRSQDLALLDQLNSGPLGKDPTFLKQTEAVRPQLERDKLFAASMQHRPVALGYVFYGPNTPGGDRQVGQLSPPAIASVGSQYPGIQFPHAVGYTTNLSTLAQTAAAQGFFSNSVDDDGSIRWADQLIEYGGNVYGSLDLAVLQVLQNNAPVQLGFDGGVKDMGHLEDIVVGNAVIPVNDQMSALVPYRGYYQSFPYISATDVIKGVAKPEALKDAIVYVGTSAAGLQDIRATPVSSVYPGVEVHANFLSGVFDNRIKDAHPQYLRGAHAVLLFLITLLISWAAIRKSITVASLIMVGTALVVFFGDLALWQYGNVVFPLASPLLYLVVLFMLHSLYGFFVESRGKRHLSRMFSQYIPPELVEEMDSQQEGYSMESDSRELTVMFADVRDFTSISEAMQPKDLSHLMNEYLTPMTRAIHTHRGTIDKYMGDAIMAFWGAPMTDKDHARHALETALDMTRLLTELNATFKQKGWPELRIGVGMTTGVMSVGDMGSEFRRAYTVMGDAVNLGSRLEGLTKQYGVQIICSEMTKTAVPDFAYLELDRVRVKGKEQPVAIYEPLGLKDAVDKNLKSLLTRHKQALAAYRNQDWDGAEKEFFALQQASPGRKLYAIYLDRVTHFRTQPPGAGWDGVFTFKTK